MIFALRVVGQRCYLSTFTSSPVTVTLCRSLKSALISDDLSLLGGIAEALSWRFPFIDLDIVEVSERYRGFCI